MSKPEIGNGKTQVRILRWYIEHSTELIHELGLADSLNWQDICRVQGIFKLV